MNKCFVHNQIIEILKLKLLQILMEKDPFKKIQKKKFLNNFILNFILLKS